ncbi:GTP cyclohydrolase 1 type 2 [Clostridia bacterium]|nr:GTP cyclohydrolase 1 type 2 [Clostridia bacterium]
MKLKEILDILENFSPLHLACSWDNPGLLYGNLNKDIQSVYLCLDITNRILEDAREKGVDLILSHHPLIFSPLSTLDGRHLGSSKVCQLVQADIAAYSIHTNFDVVPDGMGKIAAEVLGLAIEKPLEKLGEFQNKAYGIGVIGHFYSEESQNNIEEVPLSIVLDRVKKRFELEQLIYYGSLQKSIQKIALSPGSGKGMSKMAWEMGADVLISGDITHHEAIDALDMGLAVIDAGHYGIEYLFVYFFQNFLQKHFGEHLEIFCESKTLPNQVYHESSNSNAQRA